MYSGKEHAHRFMEDLHRALVPQAESLREDLNEFQDQISTWLGRLDKKTTSVCETVLGSSECIIEEALEVVARQYNEDKAFLACFAREMRNKETQEEILAFLLDSAQRFAPRAALFSVRGDSFVGWSSRGYSEEIAKNISACSFRKSESQVLQNALELDCPNVATDTSAETRLQHVFQEQTSTAWHIFPLKALQCPVAVLLAHPDGVSRFDSESLGALMDITALCIENLALKILQEGATAAPRSEMQPDTSESQPDGSGGPKGASSETEAAAIARGSDSGAVEERPSLADSAGGLSQTGETIDLTRDIPVADMVEQRNGSEQAAADTATGEDNRTPGVPSFTPIEKTHVTAAVEFEPPAIAFSGEVSALSEEEKLHADAKRFARLLVSEIKLYNEQRVVEGRENRDIYVRLKRDIDKSREMYEKRVSPAVSRKVDYFHDEIIRILGENDPSTLGRDYPGLRVEN